MQKEISLTVNGRRYQVSVYPRKTLLELLRDDLRLTGVKEGCGLGECGACTVLFDGKPVNSCLILAVDAHEREVMTIEGVSDGESLSPIQESFLQHGAVQCGFCTPGMVLAAKALLDRNPNPSLEDIRIAISGNLCRCTGYEQIVEAIRNVRKLGGQQ
jgi:carbon-monoxide dehydrogenase small subunit